MTLNIKDQVCQGGRTRFLVQADSIQLQWFILALSMLLSWLFCAASSSIIVKDYPAKASSRPSPAWPRPTIREFYNKSIASHATTRDRQSLWESVNNKTLWLDAYNKTIWWILFKRSKWRRPKIIGESLLGLTFSPQEYVIRKSWNISRTMKRLRTVTVIVRLGSRPAKTSVKEIETRRLLQSKHFSPRNLSVSNQNATLNNTVTLAPKATRSNYVVSFLIQSNDNMSNSVNSNHRTQRRDIFKGRVNNYTRQNATSRTNKLNVRKGRRVRKEPLDGGNKLKLPMSLASGDFKFKSRESPNDRLKV